jgi:hypothetical protein
MNTNIEEIRARAYQLWEEAGRPEGRDEEIWCQAEQELAEKTEFVMLEIPADSVKLESPEKIESR